MNYREWLRTELKRRQRANPSYSLRGFSQSLELSPAFLSKILNGKKSLSLESAVKVCDRLALTPIERAAFCKGVSLDRASEQVIQYMEGRQDVSNIDQIKRLEEDQFQAISDWYHFALRELVATRDFRPDVSWIASRLGITEAESTDALARLIRLKLIKLKSGRWRKTNAWVGVPSGRGSAALRRHHSQMIQKACEAIEGQSVEERDITGMTFTTNPEKIELVRKEIADFRRKIADLLNVSKPGEVYQINVQLFRLTQRLPEAKSKKVTSKRKSR